MPVAITLRAGPDGERDLATLREAIAAFETVPSMASIGYPAHLTLALYEDAGEDDLVAAVQAAAATTPALPLRFAAIRWFDGPPLTLWAAPERAATLDDLHAEVHARVDPARCHAHYRPGHWVPHCTLGNGIRDDRRQDALTFAQGWRGSMTARFDRLEIVRFPPVAIRFSASLGRAV